MKNKFQITIIFICIFSFAFSQDSNFQEITLHGVKTIKSIGNCSHNIDSMKVVLSIKINKANNKIIGQEYLYNADNGEYNLINNINWKGEKINAETLNLNYDYKSECEKKEYVENLKFIGKIKCLNGNCTMELVDEFSMCPTNNCSFQIKYTFQSEIQSYPVNFNDNLINELADFKENDERIGGFYAFDGKITEVVEGYNGKPIFQMELSKSQKEWIPSNKKVWIGSMISSVENIKVDNFIRILGSLTNVQKEDKLATKYIVNQNYMFYGFALFNLITSKAVSFEGGLKSANIWKNGNIPPSLKK
jgi:hypothetical protein